ncbi:hypothetical protein [Chitinimonas koreensis]|uniref:hypothetical protein n=1 Tax=Chitinimonas koreensis TaxID=356302 RepID=UPI0003F5D603|nr:hypothetical protein [Chitinimonas koreensis]QNM95165.1 hypothetical protein H9L41_14905 [Chitinimonas koreensis]
MTRNTIALALGAGLGAFIASVWCVERRTLAEDRSRKRVPKAELHNWEGEGGNVPDVPTPTGSSSTLSSATPPRTAAPQSRNGGGSTTH